MENLILIKLTKFFLENPYKEMYLRELAKKLKISPYAIKKYADLLVKENIIKDEKKANLRYFRANINNLFFRHLKIAFNINLIIKSELIDFLKEKLANISSIVLFGSAAKGQDTKKSDLDILVIGKKKYLNLEKIEEKIDKEITLHVFSWSEWKNKMEKDKAFYFEIISHGIPLFGELPIIEWK